MAQWESAPVIDKPAWANAPVVETGPVTANPNLMAQGLASEGSRATEFLSQRDPGIDYSTGISNAAFRAGFSRMNNDAEKAQFLDRSVGKDAWGKDSFGAYIIKPSGAKVLGIQAVKPIALDEQTTTRYDIADIAGDAPAIAGATGFGMAASGMGTVPGLLMAGLGAAGGRAVDEIAKNLQGQQVKTPGDVGKSLAGEAALAATGEVIGRAARPIGRFLTGPGSHRMTPESKALADSAISQGFKVRAGSVTDAPILARWEGMVRQIFGDIYAPQNRQAAQTGLDRLAPTQPVTKEAAGDTIAKEIRRERMKFGADATRLYDQIDQLVGDTPIITSMPLKATAKEILDAMPQTSAGKVIGGKDAFVKDILQMGDAMSVSQAQRLRTMLREASESPDLLPDVSMHDARLLKNAVNDAFDLAKQGVGVQHQNAAAAVNALKQADSFYAQGIRRFENPVVNKIAKDASRGALDADMVVDYLVKPERVVRLRQVKNAVPPQAWEQVKSAHASDLLSTIVQGTDDPLKSIFNGRAFRDALDKYGPQVLNEVHGAQWTKDAYSYANALMLAEKRMKFSGGIVAANIAVHPIQNLPRLMFMRGAAKVMEQPATFKYLTEGMKVGPNTKAGAESVLRFANQVMLLGSDETGSARITLTPPEKSP